VERHWNTVSWMSALTILGWLLAVLALCIVVPQLHRLYASGTHEGFSLRTASLASASCLAWVAYTVAEGDVPALASSLLPMFVWVACGTIVSRRRDVFRRFYVTTGVLCATTLLSVLATGWFHVMAVAGSLVWILPQVRSVLRSAHLPAVSAPAYILLFVENVGWIVYAFGTGRLAYMVAPLAQAPLAALVAFRASRSETVSPPQGNSYPAVLPAAVIAG
jgi:uncharacterized protein with PQ loop repeat